MEDTTIVELIFSLMPFLFLGFIFFILGSKSKNKYISRCKNAIKATVTNIRVEEERSADGYFKGNKYILELRYMYNGASVVSNYTSFYEYEIDSIIDLDIVNGVINTILTKPSKDVMDSLKSLNLEWYQVLLWVSYFLFGFGGVAFLLNLVDYFGDKYKYLECIVFLIIMLSIYTLANKKRDKMKDKYNLITSGGYSGFIGKVVDIKKEVRHSDGKTHVSYYPIVQYNDGFNLKKKVIYTSGNYEINQDIVIYKDRTTGDVMSEREVKAYDVKIKLFGYLITLIIIITIVGVLSFL